MEPAPDTTGQESSICSQSCLGEEPENGLFSKMLFTVEPLELDTTRTWRWLATALPQQKGWTMRPERLICGSYGVLSPLCFVVRASVVIWELRRIQLWSWKEMWNDICVTAIPTLPLVPATLLGGSRAGTAAVGARTRCFISIWKLHSSTTEKCVMFHDNGGITQGILWSCQCLGCFFPKNMLSWQPRGTNSVW